jgi:hypothetical protein
MDDIDKREAELLARLESERSARIAERIAAGEIVSVPVFIVAGSETESRAQVEQAKADKLAELRAGGDQREVVFDVIMAVTGVLRPGEAADETRKPAPPPSLPTRSPAGNLLLGNLLPPDLRDEVVEEEAVREDPPLIETYVQVQTRQCRDDDDPGEIAEGWFSVDAGQVTVTNKNGKYVGSRTMLKGEDARVVAKVLLREKKAPESEDFNRRLSYPNAGLA